MKHATIGNDNGTRSTDNDFYATPPAFLERLLRVETFNNTVWECCAGTTTLHWLPE